MTAGKKLVVLAAVVVPLILVQALRTQPSRLLEDSEEGLLPRLDEGEERRADLMQLKLAEVDKKDDELHRLLKQRYNAAVEELDQVYRLYLIKRADSERVYEAGKRLVTAGLELREKPEEQAAILGQYIEMMKNMEKDIKARVEAARSIGAVLNKARYYRLDAEIRLLRLKKKVK